MKYRPFSLAVLVTGLLFLAACANNNPSGTVDEHDTGKNKSLYLRDSSNGTAPGGGTPATGAATDTTGKKTGTAGDSTKK